MGKSFVYNRGILSLLFLTVTLLLSCQDKPKTMQTEQKEIPTYKLDSDTDCPSGYPMEVYKGSIGGTSLSGRGTTTGTKGWGHSGGGLSSREKGLPRYIDLIWLSYAEGCFYSINQDLTATDYQKMTEIFEEGYYLEARGGVPVKQDFTHIVVGMAPGGVIVLWADGPGRKIEIGRYKGEKHVVPDEEIVKLDGHGRLIFQKEYQEKTMNNPKIVLPEVKAAHEGKPIPFGLWDKYRKRYNWKPEVVALEGGEIIRKGMDMFNGESEGSVYTKLADNPYGARAIPEAIYFGFRDTKGKGFSGYVKFNEESTFKAFEEMEKRYPGEPFDVKVEIGYGDTIATARLEHGKDHIRISDNTYDIYHASRLDKKQD